MKISTTTILALALSATSALGQITITKDVASCTGDYWLGRISRKYFVDALVDDPDLVPALCGQLWDKLKRFPACHTSLNVACENKWEGELNWRFQVMGYCNHGMVESAWYEATANRWGMIQCKSKDF
ncbi:hypothetical protein CORC01_01543 [Colletotrichum orchidophilum]|uniref:Uncharacterized protein n=1 Tax=Colletotrichum orchidophilum TaxID=1209926 RepID=A0A1G4BNY2_9PEZI|nr:uncharacterized protein CORC01_01543 [Colletotrichum orchidophilum]OHF03159.1 hypothetical protein CORC01_01543 [Colletotrichum orchidophilum]